MSNIKFIKIGADGQQLPSDATDWVAVEVPDHGLTFTATSIVDSDVPQEQCQAAAKALTLAGHSDWDLPTIGELALLADSTRYSPAIDIAFFRDFKEGWYWSKTQPAWSSEPWASGPVWNALFFGRDINNVLRGSGGFALAVRRAAVAKATSAEVKE